MLVGVVAVLVGTGTDRFSDNGRRLEDIAIDAARQALVTIGDRASVGFAPTPPYTRTGTCATVGSIEFGPSVSAGAAMMRRLEAEQAFGGGRGPPNVDGTLRLAADTMVQRGTPGDQGFIVLIDRGWGSCTAGGRGATETITAFRRDPGYRVLVLGVHTGNAINDYQFSQFLDRYAPAGGLAETPPSPFSWIGAEDIPRMRRRLQRDILRSWWCIRRPAEPVVDAPCLQLRGSDGRAVPRDDAGANGWRWRDGATDTLEINGPACDGLAADGIETRLVRTRCDS